MSYTENSSNPLSLKKSFKSLNKPHNQLTPIQFESNDFQQPLSVKSNQWSTNKVNLQNLNLNNGPFAKYKSKNIIKPPSNTDIFQITPPNLENNGNVVRDNMVDDIDKIRDKQLILDLLKPKDYPTVIIDPKERIVPGLKVELFDHQVLGLNFLLKREKAKRVQRDYINLVYGPQPDKREETFFSVGGILADDMGLGKTVQIISLILQNQAKNNDSLNDKTTLIVCPASLINQWCSEIENKTEKLTVLPYHGTKRPKETEIIHKYDVVVTSYQTLSSEFDKKTSPLFDSKYLFRRIVLDEAHTIKNIETKTHKSCCNIIATRRWCLTGTPIQNKINELYALFKFLGVNRYEDSQIWNIKITTLLESKNSKNIPQVLKRLHNILDKFMLRRTKKILIDNNILTVRKKIHREILDFTPFERKIYNKLKMRIITQILGNDISVDENDENMVTINNNDNIKFDYLSVFTYLLRLRQLCCHWEILFNLTQQCDDDSLTSEITKGLNLKDNVEEKIDNALIDDELNEILNSMKSMHIDESNNISNNQNDDNATEITKKTDQALYSIKLQRVLNILKKDDKLKPRKTIIFSEFTSMLNILQDVLFENQIKFVRYDGKMDKQSKDNALKKLNESPEIHVLLCSLKCGAYGLNIVSCSRVILYEPFWNPAIGSQAIDRAYRIGQLNDVDVHEFYISDSIEMRIKELQDQKRDLMMAVVDKDTQSAFKMIGNGLSKSELLKLLGINYN